MDILFLALDVDLRLDRGDAIHTRGIASSWARAGHRVHLVVGGDGDGRGIPGVHITVRPIRGDLAIELTENLVHGSDGPESAAREVALFFPGLAG